MTNPARPDPLNLQDIATRNRNACHIVTGFSRSLPTLTEVWRYLSAALADTSQLIAEVVRQRADLVAVRLDRANLLAAIRAALAAARDGETDPLGYLRDELADRPDDPGEARMTSYRKMRRQARHARRSGLQPMMVINSGDQLPESLVVALLRWAWRYRSELAPAYAGGLLLAAGWWLHTTHRHAWPVPAVLAAVAACTLLIAGAKAGLAAVIERLYAATLALAAGGWLAAATIAGPATPPLPQAIILGGLVLAVPWWAHRRRRAKVRIERKLEAWPDIARAVGLPGSQVMSAVVDVWGWRSRPRLARGQTITDVIGRIPALESALGTFRGAVRVYPTPDDLANRCELRVLDIDPHAGVITWPGPSVSSITESIDLGPFEDAAPCRVSFLRRHGLVGGSTGSGKSGGLNVVMGNLVTCSDVVIWAIDLKRGMELGPWGSCLGLLATTPDQARALLADAVAIVQARAAQLAAEGLRTWEPSPDAPALIIFIDEYAELADDAAEAMPDADTVARLGRAVAVTLIAATQRPTQKAMGQGAVRSQMDLRIAFRVRERKDVDLILGQGMLAAGWQAHTLNAPGKFLVSDPDHTSPKRARAYLLTDQAVADTATRYAGQRPELDDISQRALQTAPADPAADPSHDPGPAEPAPPGADPGSTEATADDALWLALCLAPDEGTDVAELLRVTGMSRPTLYRRLADHAKAGRAIQVSRGRWRAQMTQEPPRD